MRRTTIHSHSLLDHLCSQILLKYQAAYCIFSDGVPSYRSGRRTVGCDKLPNVEHSPTSPLCRSKPMQIRPNNPHSYPCRAHSRLDPAPVRMATSSAMHHLEQTARAPTDQFTRNQNATLGGRHDSSGSNDRPLAVPEHVTTFTMTRFLVPGLFTPKSVSMTGHNSQRAHMG